MPKKESGGLGRALVKARTKSKREADAARTKRTVKHVSDVLGTGGGAASRMDSVIDRSDLEEFLDAALLSQKDFTAVRGEAVIVGTVSSGPWLVEQEAASARDLEMFEYEELEIPRRPEWDESTSPEELDLLERQSFLEWRRQLAKIEETTRLAITPFEKNLEMWRQLWRVVERSQLVVQIVDARNPLLFRCADLERYVQEDEEAGKKMLLLINKADLLSLKMRQYWADYFTKKGIRFAFCSAITEQEKTKQLNLKKEHGESKADSDYEEETKGESAEEYDSEREAADSENAESPVRKAESDDAEEHEDEEEEIIISKCLPTDVLDATHILHLFKSIFAEDAVEKDDEKDLVVGLVGYPNVGKSSIINTLCGAKKVAVAAMPGKTRHFQTVKLEGVGITLCDCPGLVFPTLAGSKAALVCNGILPIDRLRDRDHEPAVQWVCDRVKIEQLQLLYGIKVKAPSDGTSALATDVLQNYASLRGYMTASGRPDEARASRYVLKDFAKGRLLYCHPPPELTEEEREDFFNSLEKTSVVHRDILEADEILKLGAKDDKSLLKIAGVEEERLSKKAYKRLSKREKARLRATESKGMADKSKFRRTVRVTGYSDQSSV